MACESTSAPQISLWTEEQDKIAAMVDNQDANEWSMFFTTLSYKPDRDIFIAGADISFSTTSDDNAIASIVITKLMQDGTTDLVYSHSRRVNMQYPYIPCFLGFREAPVVSSLLTALPRSVRARIDCLLVDGNGLLHPRKAGFACQVGVKENIPTIGVSKTLLNVDGLDEKHVRDLALTQKGKAVDVVGSSGFVWGKAVITGNAKSKPIYISVGHRVSLDTACKLVQRLCKYRIPEPIRFADMHSRALLREENLSMYKPEAFLYIALHNCYPFIKISTFNLVWLALIVTLLLHKCCSFLLIPCLSRPTLPLTL